MTKNPVRRSSPMDLPRYWNPLHNFTSQNGRRPSDNEDLGSENEDGEGSPETGRAGKTRKGGNNAGV